MEKLSAIITDYEYENINEEEKVFSNQNVILSDYQCKTEEDVIKVAQNADAIITQFAPISRRVIENLNNCKVIARYGIGVDVIDVEAATDYGICVANVGDYCIDEVSDHTISLLLAAYRKLSILDKSVKNGKWDYNVAVPLYRLRGKTLGLIGFGKIAREVCRKAKVFNLNIIVFDPYISKDNAARYGVDLVELDVLIENSDFISLHVPLTNNTKQIINKQLLSRTKKDVYIINTSRAGLIDEEALIDALINNRIGGAALDVIEKMPLDKDNSLVRMDNVIITPHAAFYSVESLKDLQRIAAEEALRVLNGFYPRNFMNSELKTKLKLKEG